MSWLPEGPLSRREREVMDILYRAGSATGAEIREAMADPPTDSAVRSILRILERKGHVEHSRPGRQNVYAPRKSRERAKRTALQYMVETFFGGSPAAAMAALLDEGRDRLSEEELDRLAALVEEGRGVEE